MILEPEFKEQDSVVFSCGMPSSTYTSFLSNPYGLVNQSLSHLYIGWEVLFCFPRENYVLYFQAVTPWTHFSLPQQWAAYNTEVLFWRHVPGKEYVRFLCIILSKWMKSYCLFHSSIADAKMEIHEWKGPVRTRSAVHYSCDLLLTS